MKWILVCAGLLLLIPSAFSRDPHPLVTDGNRMLVALQKLKGLPHNSARVERIEPLLRVLVEEGYSRSSHYVGLSIRKCVFDETTSAHREAALLSHIALKSLREERALAADLLQRANAGESVTLGDAPVDPPALVAILADVRREMAEIQGAIAP